jgi:predicted nuclease of predicted toxin-antitoxin system
MRFKTDENLHPDVADMLRGHGHEVVTVWDEGLRGSPDPTLMKACCVEGRVWVTLDLGFADIREYPPEQCPGLIVLRLGS